VNTSFFEVRNPFGDAALLAYRYELSVSLPLSLTEPNCY